jgi:nicotinamide-nucleotide amidase
VADAPLVALAARVGERCLAAAATIATVESCTGGLIGHLLTEVPGSSAYYVGGFVTYSDDAKRSMVGVPAAVLAAHGAVSAQTALAMATGGRERTGADVSVSVTGIAGPDGGSAAKPVGLTYVAVADAAGGEVRTSARAPRRHWSWSSSGCRSRQTARDELGGTRRCRSRPGP